MVGLTRSGKVAAVAVAAIVALGQPRAWAKDTGFAARMSALEARLDQLESQNGELRHLVRDQQSEIDGLKSQLHTANEQIAPLTKQVSKVEQEQAAAPKPALSSTGVGFRVGWSESPYKMPGGFFYGAYLNHRLLGTEDGLPNGAVTGELMAGAVFGNHAKTAANLAGELGVPAASTWLTTVEIEPTLQYHFDLHGPLSVFEPYALAGPGIWIPVMSTPIVAKGDQAGVGFRHSDATVQPGGVFGLGVEVRPGEFLSIPRVQGILDKARLETEWRYNYLANGQQFQQYTGGIGFGL